MPEAPNNQDAYRMSLIFEQHLNSIYDSFTGYHSELIPDPNDPSKWYLTRTKRQDVTPLCNEAGGEYVVGELQKSVYNKHTAMGDLEQDEIAQIAANASTPFKMLVFYSQRFGVKDKALVLAAGLDIDTGVYTFLTSIRNGELRDYFKQILTVTIVQKPAPEQQGNKGILG